ncbi:MAG: 4-(cytidine 5'-diphospho)-2-C-methyl-D-erythritol kinase [Treponema sp.]|jgi:4-diphosphocytidyl-2-C-methyl-D-erythritol kinase|nr:4-(cytidine 5'-diphospho)-2-C-methyl-D-erythritol kinase [Treponema sp.]
MANLTIQAPAKVNLHLRVKERRPDGFHNLESIFAALAFGDTLHIELLDEDGALEMRMEGPFSGKAEIPPEKNIVSRAVSLFRSKTGYARGLGVHVDKRMPLGGGLGGGSSDAASTLIALDTLYKADGGSLDDDSLAEMAALLGSDVPFFLGKTGVSYVSGRGERLLSLKAPKNLFLVLVNPGFPSETPRAFRLLDEFREKNGENATGRGADIPNSTGNVPNTSEFCEKLYAPPRDWPFQNDFLPVFLNDAEGGNGAAYREMLSGLRGLGADFAGLSGAGSTCFGVFSGWEKAEKAEKSLLKIWNCVKVTFLLAHRAIPDYNNSTEKGRHRKEMRYGDNRYQGP